jgi:hypothetical protein
MKHFVLFVLTAITATTVFSQDPIIYRTAASGNFGSPGTWVDGGAGGDPNPAGGLCDCKIIVQPGHTLTMESTISLGNAGVILEGAGSVLTFANGVDITFTGDASINVKDPASSIIRGDDQNNILFGATVIYDGNTTYFGGTTPGRIDGPASAATYRASPQFQNDLLPVVLTDFIVSEKGNGVTVTWKTSSETNFSHFIVERSSDGKSWNAIGTVNALGNNIDQNYSFTDDVPADGANQYRLKLVDRDSKFDYSMIKSVNFAVTTLKVLAGPNPTSSFLNIKVTSPGGDPYRVRLINRAGQVVLDQKYAASTSRLQLNVANYQDGSYFLEVSKGSQPRQVSKIMIVRK